MVTADDVRRIVLALPRAYEALVQDQVKFRVGRLVFVALSRDEKTMGFGYPKHERASLIASDPEKFFMPRPSDERYHWVRARLDALDEAELRELLVDAWCMVAPRSIADEYLAGPEAARLFNPGGRDKRAAGMPRSRHGRSH
jgi:hypothetical protein